MRLESIALIALIAVGSGIAYAWWASRPRRTEVDFAREAVAGRGTVTSVTVQAGGDTRIAYRFRHPFSGAFHDGAGTLPKGTARPELGEEVDIAYLPDYPQRSCLAAELAKR